jgi:hypothetical protein
MGFVFFFLLQLHGDQKFQKKTDWSGSWMRTKMQTRFMTCLLRQKRPWFLGFRVLPS